MVNGHGLHKLDIFMSLAWLVLGLFMSTFASICVGAVVDSATSCVYHYTGAGCIFGDVVHILYTVPCGHLVTVCSWVLFLALVPFVLRNEA
jgi:hypothetical protein